MRARLPRRPSLEDVSGLAAMALAAALFMVSGLAFIALIAAALASLIALFFFPWPGVIFAVWAWVALCIAGYHLVRSIELINAPDWRAFGWIGVRSLLIALTCPFFWESAFGGWI